jgi:integrase
MFNGPGSTRESRNIIQRWGFATKGEAQDAEMKRRIEEQEKFELAKSGSGVAADPPKTLRTLLAEFMKLHAEEKLSPRTVEGYREKAAYLDPVLLAMPLPDITPLHLNREWTRLLKSGGHHRKTKEPRPLSRKTVRSVAGLVSSAFSRAVFWGLVKSNPAKYSEPPVPEKHRAISLTVAQQDLLIASSSGPGWLAPFLKLGAALGARRGEVLALRWKDIVDGRATIARSLAQIKDQVIFKSTKTEDTRILLIPKEALTVLEEHRKRQDEFRKQLGPAYKRDLDLIFCDPDGSPLKPDSVSAKITHLFQRVGIEKPKGASLHLLRHTMASHMLASGVPLPAVSARLGHSDMQTTLRIYGHMIHGQDDEAVQKWEEYQQKNRPAPPPNPAPPPEEQAPPAPADPKFRRLRTASRFSRVRRRACR